MRNAIILCAGKGTRMKSELPKGAYPILGKPMVQYSVNALIKAKIDKIVVVVGHKKEIIMDVLKGYNVNYACQEVQNGTGMAAYSAKDILLNEKGSTIITPVDMPLMPSIEYINALNFHEKELNDLTVITAIMEKPFSYGRIIRDEKGKVIDIKEELDASEKERLVKEINTGLMICKNEVLFDELAKISNHNKRNEYYLTDLIKIMINDAYKVGTYTAEDSSQTMGINDLESLKAAEKKILEKNL